MIFDLVYHGHFTPEWLESLPLERFRHQYNKLVETKKEERKAEEKAMQQAKAKRSSGVRR
jgi:hypothetical protein